MPYPTNCLIDMRHGGGNSASMNVLAIDTSAHLCAAAVLDTVAGKVVGQSVHDIGRGHSEKLMDVIGEALAAARLDYSSIGRIACSTGPGSFTGVRVGLATARGIALGLNVPVVGIGALEASCAQARHILSVSSGATDKPDILALIDAKRGEVFAQFFEAKQSGPGKAALDTGLDTGLEAGIAAGEPLVAPAAEIAAAFRGRPIVLCGSGATAVREAGDANWRIIHQLAAADIEFYARLAKDRHDARIRPEPLYLRPADAKPQHGFAIPRV